MSSRKQILEAVAASKPGLTDLPVINLDAVIRYENLFMQFRSVLESIGGKVKLLNGIQELQAMIETERKTGKRICNVIARLGEVDPALADYSATELEDVHMAFISGTLGVAENGAVWVYESQMVNRLLPFICQHLVLVISGDSLVPTMHHAMQKIEPGREGYGVFIAGPSKTADIEQSLVIGAHGARSLLVCLL